tara:strand:+ start:31546 stop:31773 length:228 start_codon:yes stop_codon:yes gene_type:complete
MHKAIRNALNQSRRGIRPKRRWIITGTERGPNSLDLDHMTEIAPTREEAWAQALAHSAGTSFTPERIELDPRKHS